MELARALRPVGLTRAWLFSLAAVFSVNKSTYDLQKDTGLYLNYKVRAGCGPKFRLDSQMGQGLQSSVWLDPDHKKLS